MFRRIARPEFVRPNEAQRSEIMGGCLEHDIVAEIDALYEQGKSGSTVLRTVVVCPIYKGGMGLEVPFLLANTAETNKGQTQLAIDTAKLSLEGLCKGCRRNLIY